MKTVVRKNLVFVAGFLAIAGSIATVLGLLGNYNPKIRYCDPRTKPCTLLELPSDAQVPPNIPTEYIPGNGLQRTVASTVALFLFAGGLVAIAKAEEEQEDIEPEEQINKQLEIKRLELQANEELLNLENLAEIKTENYRQELVEAQAELMLERNPGLAEQYSSRNDENTVSPLEPEQPLLIEKSKPKQVEPEPEPLFFGVRLPESPQLGAEFWDWQWFNTRADDLPHIRIIAPTNGGKTTLCDWLADVVPYEERKVITVKRKPHQWAGIPVYGVPFEYDVVRDQLEGLQTEMVERTRLMEKGEYRGKLSAIVDEWKAIARNVKAVKDEETKQVINPSAKEIMGDLLTLARESEIKIFALAQGRQVITWGLEGESDILECFATVYLGSFAVEEAEGMQRKFAKNSDEFAMWESVIEFLKAQGKRAAWVETEFGKFPAIAPDLSKWKREIQSKSEKVNPVVEVPESIAHDQQPMTNDQRPIPDDQSDPDKLLRQNLDRIVGSLNRSLLDSVNPEENNSAKYPELELTDSAQIETPERSPQSAAILDSELKTPEKRYTPSQLTKSEIIATIGKMRSDGMSQTKIIEQLWQVKKSGAGWNKAYREFRKELNL